MTRWAAPTFESLIVAGTAEQCVVYGRTIPDQPHLPLQYLELAPVLARHPTATRIAFNRLGPGCVLRPHAEPHIGGSRIHLPLITNEEAVMWVDGRPFHAPAGRPFTLDITREHAAANYGTHARTHLVVDLPAPASL